MMVTYEGKKGAPLRFFHVSTDGTHNGIVHFCDTDYKQAIIISAIAAMTTDVVIVCYCHMSTHSHFVLYCYSYEQAKAFINIYKRDYSRYVTLEHGESMIYRRIECDPQEIKDVFHLKNCISYTLLNPTVPGIVKHAEDYRWSSFEAYFNNATFNKYPVQSFTIRELRAKLRTRQDLTNSAFMLDDNGNLVIKSFVDYKFVESLFRSKADFYKSLAMTNSISEEETYVKSSFKYSDTEVIAEALTIAKNKFGKNSIQMLTKEEKHKLLPTLRKKTYASPKKLARILRLEITEVNQMLGMSQASTK